jgi:hypothetical protein
MPCFGLLNLCVISSAARSLEYLHVSFPQSFNLATRPVPNGGAFQTPELPGASAMTAKQAPSRENPVLVDTFEERHFTLAEIAKMWRISREKARRLFLNEPGVIRFHGSENNTREYNTYRVPESVARRVRLRLMNI